MWLCDEFHTTCALQSYTVYDLVDLNEIFWPDSREGLRDNGADFFLGNYAIFVGHCQAPFRQVLCWIV